MNRIADATQLQRRSAMPTITIGDRIQKELEAELARRLRRDGVKIRKSVAEGMLASCILQSRRLRAEVAATREPGSPLPTKHIDQLEAAATQFEFFERILRRALGQTR